MSNCRNWFIAMWTNIILWYFTIEVQTHLCTLLPTRFGILPEHSLFIWARCCQKILFVITVGFNSNLWAIIRQISLHNCSSIWNMSISDSIYNITYLKSIIMLSPHENTFSWMFGFRRPIMLIRGDSHIKTSNSYP
ncbi:hypothetical protein C481_20971 [Natrialba asiatica DSM 12278]|uniref:Uncharacterized protein n=1 Tax=Natrialba asiatica (strain ATCC 700177 / DSM 12278 / JCM 9576 / FERM P-10747 / NBRC 102637 / 172P1) TaxID=29540 RepID=M0AIA1_NATA1|nr:hypothetical protein C481_20971 [Natrialba asiatica DSM 12278]